MLGFSKKEKEEANKHTQEIQEKIKIHKENVDKYYSLIGLEVKIGLGVRGVLDDIDKKYIGDDIEEYRYYYNVRILSANVIKNVNNIRISSGIISGIDCPNEESHSIFECIKIPCDVIVKLNKD